MLFSLELHPGRTSMYYYTYILQSLKDKRFYAGFTSDLRKRFQEHNDGIRNKHTLNRRPFKLIYYEACLDYNDAIQREKYFKTGRGKRYIKERLKRFLVRTG